MDNYDTAVTLMKEKFGSKESILETHLCQATPDIKCSVEKLLRQLESQGEVINEHKMLIYSILSKVLLETVVKLEDATKGEGEWTMKILRKWSNQHITIPQCRVANAKGRVYTYDSRQVK